MAEGQAGLRTAYGDSVAGEPDDLDEIVKRFANASLGDTVARVGRDVRRKLAAGDRLIGAALLAQKAGRDPVYLARTAAAALCFEEDGGPPLAVPSRSPATDQVRALLAELTHLDPASLLVRRVELEWSHLVDGWETGNLLLSLEDHLWSWSSHRPGEQSAREAS